MADSSDSVSVDIETTTTTMSVDSKEYIVETGCGPVSVSVVGDQDKPALVTYPDLALNYVSCFQGLFACQESWSLLLQNFCIYHISPPGLELGATATNLDEPLLSVNDLVGQIVDVLDYFGLGAVMCMGVTAGAYILASFAMKHRQRVLGLILISPICKAPSWTEWLCSKVMSNLLYFYGMCSVAKEMLIRRYFGKDIRGNGIDTDSDIVVACRHLLDETQGVNIMRIVDAFNRECCKEYETFFQNSAGGLSSIVFNYSRRSDISEGLNKLQCRSLIFVGEDSPFHSEAIHMASKLDRRHTALVEVQGCGSLVTEEQPHAMLIPLEYFLMGYGFYRQSHSSVSPRSPLSPTFISPELLSPESMGLKLKPIKTRTSLEV